MKKYVAKTKHAKPCDLCGDPILPGDTVKPWCWWNYEGDDGTPFGGICRAHVTCYAIGDREGLMEETLRTFADADESRWDAAHDDSIPDEGYLLTIEADAALKADREANPTPERSVLRLREALRPFAELAARFTGDPRKDAELFTDSPMPTAADWRAAAEAFAATA